MEGKSATEGKEANIILYTWWDGDVPFYVGIGRPFRLGSIQE
jgi:hypothetical protein